MLGSSVWAPWPVDGGPRCALEAAVNEPPPCSSIQLLQATCRAALQMPQQLKNLRRTDHSHACCWECWRAAPCVASFLCQ